MQNLEDPDGCKTIDDEIDPNMTDEQVEFDLVNQIDYLIGFINRLTNNAYQHDVIEILCNSTDLMTIRRDLVNFVSSKQIVKKKLKK